MNRERYQFAKEAGVCPYCYKPVAEGEIYCPECNEKESFRQHVNYIKRKFGVDHDEAVRIAKEKIVERRPKRKPPARKKQVKAQTLNEVDRLAKEASEREQHYVSYGEMVARQSGAYDWKINSRRSKK